MRPVHPATSASNPKCRKPMQFLLCKTGGRTFRCLDCAGDDPMRSSEVAKLLAGELRPLE
jgi:hypothetical protein